MPEEKIGDPINLQMSDQYSTIYFSGAQTEVWVGDFMLEEAVEIEGQYSMAQIPIYGYKSAHFSTAASGKVIVSGSLILNYKFDGYLYAHIKAAMDKVTANGDTILKALNKLNAAPVDDKLLYGPPQDETQGIIAEVINRPEGLFTDFDDESISQFQKEYWDGIEGINPLNAPARPDFVGPFNIKIKDYRVGHNRDASPQTKTLINCFINQYGTVRRVDGTPVVEVYQFISQTLL